MRSFLLAGAASALPGGIHDRRHRRDPGDARVLQRARHPSRDELIAAEQINDAWERVLSADVRYRFVIDAHSL
jgi:hypothetical protein